LEDPDFYRGPTLRRPNGALDHRPAYDQAGFETYVETQLAPVLNPGDVVILDNLPGHKSDKAAKSSRSRSLVPLPSTLQPGFEPY
jgi:hypothetical protein